MKLGKELAELTAGLAALYRDVARSDGFLDREGLIPVAVAHVQPTVLRDYQEASDALQRLRGRLAAEAESALRQAYLDEMIDSLLALVMTFEGKEITYAERLCRQMRVQIHTVDDAILDGYHATIRENLALLGYGGADVATDLRRWEEDARIPADAVLETLRGFVAEARTRSAGIIADGSSDWLEPVEIRDVPFSAYCDYPGRKLLLNLDYPYTAQSLKHLAVHEAFPGHLVHLARRERLVRAGTMPLDGAQVVTSSASSALFEGIAENGLFFLDWVNAPEDELAIALQRLRSALRCNAAWMLHAEGLPPAEVGARIAEAGFQDSVTATSRLAFLRHGLRAPFTYAYWCGDKAVHDIWQLVTPERRAEFWDYLYSNMHTPSTLRNFWH